MMLPSKFTEVVDGQGSNFGWQTNQQFVPGTKFLCAALWWCAQSFLKSARSSAQHILLVLLSSRKPSPEAQLHKLNLISWTQDVHPSHKLKIKLGWKRRTACISSEGGLQ